MIREFDHRFGSYEYHSSRSNSMLPTPSVNMYSQASYIITPWYWVEKKEAILRGAAVPEGVKKAFRKGEGLNEIILVWLYGWYRQNGSTEKIEGCIRSFKELGYKKNKKEIESLALKLINEFPLTLEQVILLEEGLQLELDKKVEQVISLKCPTWLFGFRNVARSTDERTGIFTILPFSGVGHSMPLIHINDSKVIDSLLLISNFFLEQELTDMIINGRRAIPII